MVGSRSSVSSRERISDGPKPYLPGEQVVELQAGAIERRLPPVVVRHHEAEIADQVRRVLQQQAALVQRLHHQPNVALLQVAHAAVHQLGAAAGRAFAEVALLQQQRGISAAGRVDRDAGAGRAAADDDDVPGAGVRLEAAAHLLAGQRTYPCAALRLPPARWASSDIACTPRGVDPAVIEIEQRADGDRVIDRLVVPASRPQGLHVFRAYPRRIGVDLLHEAEQRLVAIVERARIPDRAERPTPALRPRAVPPRPRRASAVKTGSRCGTR